MIDPLFARLSSVALGALLVAAAWHKFSMGARLEAVVAGYRLLPGALVPVAGRIVPLVEMGLGLALLSGLGGSAAALAAATLFGLYGFAIAINILRGRVHIDCGCGLGAASGSGQPLSWYLVLRNALLAALALLLLAPAAPRSLGPADWAILVAAALALGLLYLSVHQLSANRAAIRVWRQPRV